jgi:hypothetical protein
LHFPDWHSASREHAAPSGRFGLQPPTQAPDKEQTREPGQNSEAAQSPLREQGIAHAWFSKSQ